MMPMSCRCLPPALAAAVAMVLSGCIVSPTHEAPIVDRSRVQAPAPMTAPKPAVAERPAAPSPREARDGQYAVQPGDTLYSVALAFGQDYRDIARWNGLDDPSKLKLGQVLRVAPPEGDSEAAAAAAEAVPVPLGGASTVQSRPLEAPRSDAAAAGAAAAAAPSGEAAPSATPPAMAAAAPAPADAGWAWPGTGKLIDRFDGTRNKGIDLGGAVGDAVLAANDGQVVYSGSGLRGYGNLVIIKHSEDFVSAYAHNSEILVTQGQSVRRGQKIAALGSSDAPDPRLHFEIRRKGKPVDPLEYLPRRPGG